mgnify:CR=1 FL=1
MGREVAEENARLRNQSNVSVSQSKQKQYNQDNAGRRTNRISEDGNGNAGRNGIKSKPEVIYEQKCYELIKDKNGNIVGKKDIDNPTNIYNFNDLEPKYTKDIDNFK